MYKIEILDNCLDNKFKQLEKLIEKFAITIFMIQKYNLSNKSNLIKKQYISNYKEFLSENEIE